MRRCSSKAMRVVTAARWSGSLACRRPSSRLTSKTIPRPADPCIRPSSQASTWDKRAPFYRGPQFICPRPPAQQMPARSGLRRLQAPLEPGAPLVHALAGAGAGEHALDARVDSVQVPEELLQVEVQVLEEVYLVHQHEVDRKS